MNKNIVVSTDKDRLDVLLIHDFISNRSYWGKGRTLEQVKITVDRSICFGAYMEDKQVGFARVLTDTVSLAYIFDLLVFEAYRGMGVSRKLIEAMLNHDELQTVTWMLGTNDAHGLYKKYGFSSISNSNRLMKRPCSVSNR